MRYQGIHHLAMATNDMDKCKSIYFTDPNGIALEASAWTMDVFHKPHLGDRQPVPSAQEDGA